MTLPPALLPYQQAWVNDRSRMKVCVKSRQIGITWATGFEAVEVGALARSHGGRDFWYQAYAQDVTEGFVADCATWARAIGAVFEEYDEEITDDEAHENFVLADGENSVLIHTIRFASGNKIGGLSHAPRKLRSRNGVYCLDEASYHENLKAAIEASNAFGIWGGRSMIISSIGDEDHEFAELVADIRAGRGVRGTYSLHEITLPQAVEQGLYRRICYVTGKEWTPERERGWLEEKLAEEGAETEYLCVPRRRSGTRVFMPREWCEFVDAPPPRQWVTKSVRGWDRAATKPNPKNKDPDWTRGVKLQWTNDGNLWVVDGIGLRDSPGAVTDAILAAARADGIGTIVSLWQDPGAAGVYEADDMHRRMAGFDVRFTAAREAKQVYWGPVASAMRPSPGSGIGSVKIVRGAWTDDFCTELSRVPNAPHDDWADALAGAFLVGTGVATDFRIDAPPRRRAISL